MVTRTAPDQIYDSSKPPGKIIFRYAYRLSKCPGFSLVGLEVHFPPGAATPPHRHGGAQVAGTVISGRMYNKMNNDPTQLLEAGDVWHEHVGCHHKTSANASDTDDLVIFASLVIESTTFEEGGVDAIVIIDEEYR